MAHWLPWWIVIFAVFCISSCLEEGDKFVCQKQETYMTTIRVSYNKPYQLRVFTWCAAIPPRCSKYRIAYTTGYRTISEISTRTVNFCCKGYVLAGDESSCIPFCSNSCIRGICVGPEECQCQPGFGGLTCNVSCPAGKYGSQCARDCICKNQAQCDPVTGSCSCKPGWQGFDCSVPCDEGFYGYRCEQECGCENHASCDSISGSCKCAPGYRGNLCSEPCPEGTYGESCTSQCECQNGGTCNHVTGECSCLPGWMGDDCAKPCSSGYYGDKCLNRCTCLNDTSCHHLTGECICAPGYRGERCQYECPIDKWGPKCANNCSCENGGKCDSVDGTCICPAGFTGDHCESRSNCIGNWVLKAVDCTDVLHLGHEKSGIYEIWPMNKIADGKSIYVYCDMNTDGGGWTVIQRRGDFLRSKDYFFKDWKSYKEGFGDINKDFWLGNDNIFSLTNQKLYSARFDLGDVEKNKKYALYDIFWIDDESRSYTLHISDYSGDANDSMTAHNNQKFTTKDQDNDSFEDGNCAEMYKGGWWYNACHSANLNGLYHKGKHESFADGVNWYNWKGYHESLEWTEIKIRPKSFHPSYASEITPQ